MPSDESKGNQLDAIGSLAQRQLDNTVPFLVREIRAEVGPTAFALPGLLLSQLIAR